MGVVNLARVDERLIHGQVMVTLSQKSGVNSIFVVDDVVANDKFMRELYKNAGSRTGQKTIVITTEKAKFYWDEYQFKDYNCILIAKTVKVMYELVKHGIPMKELNIGGIVSDQPLKELAQDLRQVRKAMEDLGYVHDNVIMSLSTLSLPVSPELKVTDYGMLDTYHQTIVPLMEDSYENID